MTGQRCACVCICRSEQAELSWTCSDCRNGRCQMPRETVFPDGPFATDFQHDCSCGEFDCEACVDADGHSPTPAAKPDEASS